MLKLFKKDPKAKFHKAYLNVLESAMKAQRNGDIKTYSILTEKAEKIKAQMGEM